jgi:hypothetical protein
MVQVIQRLFLLMPHLLESLKTHHSIYLRNGGLRLSYLVWGLKVKNELEEGATLHNVYFHENFFQQLKHCAFEVRYHFTQFSLVYSQLGPEIPYIG